MAVNLSNAQLCINQAKSLDALSSVIKKGYKQLNIVGGNTPVIVISSDKVYKLPMTPEAVKAISVSMASVLDGAVAGLIQQAKTILDPVAPTTSTPPVIPVPVATVTPTPTPVATAPTTVTNPSHPVVIVTPKK